VRIALLVLAVLAIVLPTALIPETASAHGSVYSVQQVLRVFRAEGIQLQRQAEGEANSPVESFSGPGKAHLGVSVFEPTSASETSYSSGILTSGSVFPQLANQGNVTVDWTPPGNGRAEAAKVHAALGRLRYSASDANLHPPPTIALLPVQSRLLHVPPIGTEVDCVHGSSDDSEILRPASRTSSSSEYSGTNVVASLSWRRVSGSAFAVSCSGLAPLPPLKTLEQDVARGSSRLCRSGPQVVRVAGLAAHVPHGWYVAASPPQQALWIANGPRCDEGRAAGRAGISLTMKLEMRIPESWPGRAGAAFLIRTDRSTLRDVRHGFDFDSFPYQHRFYSLSAFFGGSARDATAIDLANSVLRGVKPAPR
jgi:hypothetical protein